LACGNDRSLFFLGGASCDWERAQLRNVFKPKYPGFKLKQLGDFGDMEDWLKKNGVAA
jgi:hypothetical protein